LWYPFLSILSVNLAIHFLSRALCHLGLLRSFRVRLVQWIRRDRIGSSHFLWCLVGGRLSVGDRDQETWITSTLKNSQTSSSLSLSARGALSLLLRPHAPAPLHRRRSSRQQIRDARRMSCRGWCTPQWRTARWSEASPTSPTTSTPSGIC
jgi:hypothetical protein